MTDEDIAAVAAALRCDWLTTGPRVEAFERAVADYVGASEAVAVSSGSAALHAALHALEIGPGDEVIVPALTFVATANCVVYQGARPVLADVEPDTLLVNPASVEALITPRTRAILAVDYAGQPCDYARLRSIAQRHGLALVADGCHALGGALVDWRLAGASRTTADNMFAERKSVGNALRGVPGPCVDPPYPERHRGRSLQSSEASGEMQPTEHRVGTLADLTAFSLHPVKAITTGEGGLVTTDRPELARRVRRFRNHGLDRDARARSAAGTWRYEQVELGYNYRLSDVQCALGLSQLGRLDEYLLARRRVAAWYGARLADHPAVRPLKVRPDVLHAWHLYVVRLAEAARLSRDALWRALRTAGIGTAVHYRPVHLHPFYRRRFGTRPGLCPVAEAAAERILSIPMYPAIREADVERIVAAIDRAARQRRRRAA